MSNSPKHVKKNRHIQVKKRRVELERKKRAVDTKANKHFHALRRKSYHLSTQKVQISAKSSSAGMA